MSDNNTTGKLIKDLILFYVKENYNHHLSKNNLKKIQEDKIREVVVSIYQDKKDHLKEFLKGSLKELMTERYIGDLALLNICNEIFDDDELCINRLTKEIENYQNEN